MKKDLTILQGETFQYIIRWETSPVVFKAISGVTLTAPVVLTVDGHGLPNGWSVAIESVQGTIELNASHTPPWSSDYEKAEVIDANHIRLPNVNASEFSAYASGGYIRYNTPQDLSGYTARMTIKDRVGGTTLLSLTTTNGGIEIDDNAKTILLIVEAADTAAITWLRGVYDLELESPGGVVTRLMSGRIMVSDEVTT